ncbi:MAG TPA: hypothetical protein VNN18_12575 [Candidatus Xenobia bacterium]|nr:hypothetical protein [Candidatus Xenobia bacterium]
MRAHKNSGNPIAWGATLAVAFCLVASSLAPLRAGGPVIIGGGSTGGFGPDGQAFVWTASPIGYRTDGVTGLGVITKANADTRVAGMFQAWQDVPTSDITFSRLGDITGVADNDVSTVAEFNAVNTACNNGTQSPIVYDQTGSLFDSLNGPDSGVIGFAGACQLTSLGVINSAIAALNGEFRDGVNNPPSNFELTDNEFDAVFIHEFGHFFGLDHSQINLNCLSPGCADFSDDSFGLPTMFPFLISGLEESPSVHPAGTISMDDAAWVSELYPEAGSGPGQLPYATNRGTITGTLFFSDGITAVQGGNVIARQVDDPMTIGINESRRNAVSNVSGYLFTEIPGNTTMPGGGASRSSNPFGSANVALRGTYRLPGLTAGSYTVEAETINPAFTGGSGVGPLRIQIIPLPGPAEFLSDPETNSDASATARTIMVAAGSTSSGQNIILNNTPPRFDGFDAVATNNTVGTATPIGNGTHRFSLSPFTSQDDDFLSFTAPANTTVTFEVIGRRNVNFTSLLDSIMEITNTSGTRQNTCRALGSGGSFNQTCFNDDLNFPSILDSGLEFRSVAGGTFVVHINEFRGDARPDFQYDLIVTGTANNAPDIFLNGTVNAASFAPAAPVSPGSIAATFGSNLANPGVAGAVPLPTTLGGATMRINGQLIPLFFTSAGQANIQIPWEMAGQAQADIVDNFGGVNGGGEPVGLTLFAPGIFSTAQNGMGQGAILIANTTIIAAPTNMFPGSRPAHRTGGPGGHGDFLEIYWTGGGPVTNQPATGAAASASPLSATTTTPALTIGGVPTPVLFSGLAPGFVGLYVVTCQVQSSTPTGNSVPVVLTQGGAVSNTVTIAVD